MSETKDCVSCTEENLKLIANVTFVHCAMITRAERTNRRKFCFYAVLWHLCSHQNCSVFGKMIRKQGNKPENDNL